MHTSVPRCTAQPRDAQLSSPSMSRDAHLDLPQAPPACWVCPAQSQVCPNVSPRTVSLDVGSTIANLPMSPLLLPLSLSTSLHLSPPLSTSLHLSSSLHLFISSSGRVRVGLGSDAQGWRGRLVCGSWQRQRRQVGGERSVARVWIDGIREAALATCTAQV